MPSLKEQYKTLPKYGDIRKKHEIVHLGGRPPTKSLAWWYLSYEARRLLDQKREEGLYGGIPGKAPYWMIQEEGNAGAEIQAQFYLKNTLEYWEDGMLSRLSKWLMNNVRG